MRKARARTDSELADDCERLAVHLRSKPGLRAYEWLHTEAARILRSAERALLIARLQRIYADLAERLGHGAMRVRRPGRARLRQLWAYGRGVVTAWGYHTDPQPELWIGTFNTREDAIAAAQREYPGETIYVIRGRLCNAAEFTPDVDRIIEWMGEAATDEVGEAADDYPDVSDAARAELTELLHTWADKHCKPTFWQGVGEPEMVKP